MPDLILKTEDLNVINRQRSLFCSLHTIRLKAIYKCLKCQGYMLWTKINQVRESRGPWVSEGRLSTGLHVNILIF